MGLNPEETYVFMMVGTENILFFSFFVMNFVSFVKNFGKGLVWI